MSEGYDALRGGVSLSNQAMSFEGKATLTLGGVAAVPAEIISSLLSTASSKPVSGITVPFSIGGTLSNPTFLPGKGIPGVGTNPAGASKSVKADAISSGIQSLLKKKH